MAQNLNINITARDRTKQAFNGIRGGLSSLKNAVFSLKGAFVGLGAGLVVKSFITTGKSVEDLQVRLKQLFGSTQEGAKAFDVMANFAGKVPFSLEQIQQASGNLAVVAGDADRLSKILEITGNVAAVTGIDFNVAAEQIQRSFAGGIAAADIFREKGVRDMLGFSAGATVSAEETIKAFEKVFSKNGRFGKATEELSTTFTGTLSMLGDKLFNFKRTVAGAEFFDELKKEFKGLNKFIEENTEDFEAIANAIGFVLTKAVQGFAMAVRGVAKAVSFLRNQYENLIRLLNKIPFVNIEIGKTIKDNIAISEDYKDQIMLIAAETKSLNKSLVKQKTILEEITELLKKDLKAITNVAKQVTGILNDGIRGFSKGVAEAIVLGKELNTTFKELAQTLAIKVLSILIEVVARKTVELAIEKLITREKEKQAALSGGSSFFSIAKSFLGFAKGGAVSKGKPIMVGEKGPEMFVPNSTGQITQAARGTGGGTVNVNFNIEAIDSSSFNSVLVENRGIITSIINNALNEKGRRELV